MKGLFVFFLATAIISVSKADLKSTLGIHQGRNISNDISSRIIQGTPATLGAFPHHARLVLFILINPVAQCGGSIISRYYVLTAAHCLSTGGIPFTSFGIEVGSVTAGQPEQSFTVLANNAQAHPQYDSANYMNDVAIIHNTAGFVFGPNVKAILLASFKPNANANDYVGVAFTVTGYGYTTSEGEASPVLLYTKNLVGISFEDCQSVYGDGLARSSYCVQDPQPPVSAICGGDSGGPVIVEVDGQAIQLGIVSYGADPTCEAGPQGMTHVALVMEWINLVTGIFSCCIL